MTKMGRYRYWGDQKPDTSRPLLTITRAEAVAASQQTTSTQQPASTGTLRIYGPIDSWGGYWGVSAKEVAQALDLLGDADQIVVRVNSPGGESSEGRAIMNLLRASKAKTVSIVDGGAYSAASYIAVGCDETVMAPGTTLMIHDTSSIIYGNAEDHRKEADVLDTISNSGAELYAQVAGGTVEQWRELQRAETWYTAAAAVAAGLIDRVGIVPDAGPAETAGETAPEPVDAAVVDDRARATYDLSLFQKAPEGLPKPPHASAGGTTQPEGAAVVDLNDTQITALREQVGFPADADADTIVQATLEALNERATDTPPGHAEQTGNGLPAAVLTQLGLPASADEATVVAAFAEMRENALAGRQAAEQLRVAERDAFLDAHRDRFTPAARGTWEAEYDRNPTATREHLENAEVIVPLELVGHDVPVGEGAAQDDGWFPGYATVPATTQEA